MEVLFNHIKRKETDKEELPFPKKAGLISTFTMSNMLLKRIALIVRCIQSGDLLDCPLFAIKPPLHPRASRCSLSKYLYTKHFPKHTLLDLPRSLMPRGKVHQNRGSGVHSRQETQKMRTGHSATRKDLPPSALEGGPAAKRWEGLVFSTAECPRGTPATEKVGMITRFRRHLPGTGSAIAGLVRGRDCRTTGSLSLR